jgi:hypothetical protein
MGKKWEKPTEGSWFLIMVSWETGADKEAQEKFLEVLQYLKIFENLENRDTKLENLFKEDPADARLKVVPESLKALNLIGRRKFVIIFQTKSNKVLLELSKMISWGGHISAEIFPASYVFEVERILFPEPKM